MNKRSRMIQIFWQFLNQPLFDPHAPAILNLRQFWQIQEMEHLERCWMKNYRPEERFRS